MDRQTHRHRDRKLPSPVRKKKLQLDKGHGRTSHMTKGKRGGGSQGRGELVSVTTGFALEKI